MSEKTIPAELLDAIHKILDAARRFTEAEDQARANLKQRDKRRRSRQVRKVGARAG
jgi:hypothetical protein